MEADLYQPMLNYLLEEFQVIIRPATGGFGFHAEEVSRHGPAIGGRWQTPDLVSVEYWSAAVIPESRFSVRTFEVKLASTCDITSVHQALAHSRFADFVYLCAPFDADLIGSSKRRQIERSCEQFGIGLFWLEVRNNGELAVHQENAAKQQPVIFEAVDEFLSLVLSDVAKKKVKGWKL